MAKRGDFFHIMEENGESAVHLAYLLIMANVLGLAVFLDNSKKKTKTFTGVKEDLTVKQAASSSMKVEDKAKTDQVEKVPIQIQVQKDADVQVTNTIEQNAKDGISEEKAQESVKAGHVQSTTEKKVKEQSNKDNIIELKEVMASKGRESKRHLEPLVWRFPKK